MMTAFDPHVEVGAWIIATEEFRELKGASLINAVREILQYQINIIIPKEYQKQITYYVHLNCVAKDENGNSFFLPEDEARVRGWYIYGWKYAPKK